MSGTPGEIFQQRRAAAASKQQAAKDGDATSANNANSKRSSFLEIQQEQQQQKQTTRSSSSSSGQGSRLLKRDSSSSLNQRGGFNGGGFNGGGSNGGGGRGTGRRSSSRRSQNSSSRSGGPDFTDFPLELGIICSLKESFGFIHCADREAEVFFHYSYLDKASVHSDDLAIDMEVEFRIGPSSRDPQQNAAYDVRPLPEGRAIEWEFQEQPGVTFQGHIDRVARSDRSGRNDTSEGTIRLLPAKAEGGDNDKNNGNSNGNSNSNDDDDDDTNGEDNKETAKQQAVKYIPNSYTPTNKKRTASRLGKGDLVEFVVVIDRRTKSKFAREIKLLKSEREAQQQQREMEQLQNATIEQGVVVSIKADYGFIKSNQRKQQVYFHISSLGDLTSEQGETINGAPPQIQIGQEVEFKVLQTQQSQQQQQQPQGRKSGSDNGNNNNNNGGKSSARHIKLLQPGTVRFRKIVGQAITGIVSLCPQPPALAGTSDPYRKNKSTDISGAAVAKDGSVLGKLRLLEPLVVPTVSAASNGEDQAAATTTTISEITFAWDQVPGGIYSFPIVSRGGGNGAASGFSTLWIKPGDRLCFDVVHDFAEDAFLATPILLDPKSVDAFETPAIIPGKAKMLQLSCLSLAGRYEGVIQSLNLQRGFGFIQFAETNATIHFKIGDVMPEAVHSSLYGKQSDALRIGASVSFDLTSRAGKPNTSRGKSPPRRGRNAARNEKELVQAYRVTIHPLDQPVQHEIKAIANTKATVVKEDKKQLYAGALECEVEFVDHMTLSERHPTVARMLRDFYEESDKPNGRQSIMYFDTIPLAEDHAVVALVNDLYYDTMEVQHVPVAKYPAHPGRLRISRRRDAAEESAAPVDGGSKDGASEEHTGGNGADQGDVDNKNGDAGATSGAGAESPSAQTNKAVRKRKKQPKGPTKHITFSKQSLTEAAKDDVPPNVGDTIVCDLYMIRRNGRMTVRNMRVVERAEREEMQMEGDSTSGVGIVKEFHPKRNFGFVHVLDETATKRDILFFNMPPSSPSATSGGGDYGKNIAVKRGDEVSFDIVTETNGKTVAKNVQLMKKNSIPNKTAKNACFGFILLEPSHTKLSDTPARKLRSTASSGSNESGKLSSRWDNTADAPHKAHHKDLAEEGSILLVDDKTGMFNKRKAPPMTKSSGSIESVLSIQDESAAETKEAADANAAAGGAADGESQAATQADANQATAWPPAESSMILHHIPYKSGSTAIHGAGSTTCFDGSTKPRRGDYVSFVKGRDGKGARDIRVVRRQHATRVRGRLENIVCLEQDDDTDSISNAGTARFIAATADQKEYNIDLSEVVSCSAALLKEKDAVEGVVYQGQVFGICRTTDLYLESKLGTKHKERPKLNLTVKRDRGGTIMAQSMMAKGPDGTTGFAAGWTNRTNPFVSEAEAKEGDAQADAGSPAEEEATA